MTDNYKVVKIANNLKDYPDCKEDTNAYPELVKHVQDEMDLFIVDEDSGEWFPSNEFFYMVKLTTFTKTS